MRTVLKHIVANTYKPLLVKYLSKTRIYRHQDICIEVPPQVFHPGFFFSTHFLLQYISKLQLQGKKMLELGAGSGLIAMLSARKGAIAFASDINPVAIEFLHKNSRMNNIPLTIIQSDLFLNIPAQQFDLIAVNPPYYKKEPVSVTEQAWYCGEQGEYFNRLFEQLPSFIHNDSIIVMVLCEGCDMAMINGFAADNGFQLKLQQTKRNTLEKDFIFTVERIT